MTTEEAIEELENIRTPWEYMEDAKKAVEVVKAALADATARAERAEKACRAVRLTLGLTLGELLPGQQKITAKEIREAAERAYAAANLDAPATGDPHA